MKHCFGNKICIRRSKNVSQQIQQKRLCLGMYVTVIIHILLPFFKPHYLCHVPIQAGQNYIVIVKQTEINDTFMIVCGVKSPSVGSKGPVKRCNFSCNLQCNSTFERCKIVKYKFPSQFANIFFNIPNICHKFTSLKSRIALQIARKIAPCDRAFSVEKKELYCNVNEVQTMSCFVEKPYMHSI